MSLVYCPECGHEVSLNAVACANCAHPMVPPVQPVVDESVVVMPDKREGFPTWALIPIGLLAVILVFVLYLAFREPSDDTSNLNVNVARRGTTDSSRPSTTTTVPSTTDTSSVTVPGQTTVPPTVPGQTTTVPGSTTSVPSAPAPTKGTVVINAKVTPARGSVQNVRNAKFYLLDDDIESILSRAGVEPIEGNTVAGSLGLAAVYPDRFGEFQRAAQRAIASHVKYSGTTDGSGKSSLSGIEPNQYYLFGITKVGNGFAMWSSPVSIIAGENVLNLSPQSVTEIPRGD